MRAGRPVSNTRVVALLPRRLHWLPAATGVPEAARTVSVPPASYRAMIAKSTWKHSPDLLGHRREHLLRRRPACHQRRYSP
jgi:hypothetical protein